MALRRIAVGSTVEAVLDQLREHIQTGEWPTGERIPGEHHLSAELGVSRPVVREAIRSLAVVGVLESRPGDGTYVRTAADPGRLLRDIARAGIRDVFEVQLAVDVQAARLAATRRTAGDLRRLETLLAERDEAREPAAFGAADARFHLGVVEAAHNPLLLETYRFFLDRLREALREIRRDREIPEAGPAAHRAVVDAIQDADPDAAARAAAAIVEPLLVTLDGRLSP